VFVLLLAVRLEAALLVQLAVRRHLRIALVVAVAVRAAIRNDAFLLLLLLEVKL
jgi:hypothetical protein